MHSTDQAVNWMAQRDALICHRQLLVISGEHQWALKAVERFLTRYSSKNILWFGESAPANVATTNQFKSWLGQEIDLLIYNSFSGLRGNALMALSGCVAKQGLMILLCPELKIWPQFVDPQIHRRVSYGFEKEPFSSPFVQWLCQHITNDANVNVVTEDAFSGTFANVIALPLSVDDRFCASQDQKSVVDKILALVKRPRCQLVITSDRGRGKSSALAIAAALMHKSEKSQILVTASHASQTSTVFGLYGNILDQDVDYSSSQSSIGFQPFDVILKSTPDADVLFVDEAASIPNNVLEKLLEIYPRIIFSTTVSGYEGSGRGFELRFKPYLRHCFPDTKFIRMDEPIRWYQDDCLEQFWNRVFAMDYQTCEPLTEDDQKSALCQSIAENVKYECMQGRSLINHPTLLKDVFNLLVDAHYQTSPDDFVRMLDAPDHQVHILSSGGPPSNAGHPLAVALTVREGGEILDNISDDIALGKRRVPGHLTAQRMAFEYCEPMYTSQNYIRVVRIAVQANARRLSLGSKLLGKIETSALKTGVDALSTSFGITQSLLTFWHKANYQLVKMGIKKDASSGEYSALLIKPLHQQSKSLFDAPHLIATEQIRYQQSMRLQELSKDILESLSAEDSDTTIVKPMTQIIAMVVKAFRDGHRPLSNSEWYLFVWFNDVVAESQKIDNNSCEEKKLAINFLHSLLIEKRDYSTIRNEFKLTGKKQIEDFSRKCVNTLSDFA